ncbi:DUF3788 domain-containing protein [Candidatus Enterococcus murrayae]|uniref:DUF3788 domain-containing protein n=1 Tax=Candidatus Enterococcus murrayae TaxID=2815321 RepID=A0ABS3HBQ0_9ENTE|nr:DUF3788 domain-containing protein [Enterococcus sp. MJM16]MBO0450867.1 DUF3788 domain-containing protein [Enterococcus sp. MJM16]
MQWYELFHEDIEPTDRQISDFISNPLWQELSEYLIQTYAVKPKRAYSGCSMGEGYWKGWNIKFKKNGKALCTAYPKQGYFVAMVSFSAKELDDANALVSMCCEYTKNKYQNAKSSKLGKSISFEVTDQNILQDIKELAALRARSTKKTNNA